MSDREILQSLQKATIAAVAASSVPTMPVAYIGRTFTPPVDQKYLEVVFIPNNGRNDFWGAEKIHRGFYRLILHWPNDNTGAYTAMNYVESVGAYFTKNTLLDNYVRVINKPDLIAPIQNGTEMLYSVSIEYQRLLLA